MVPYNKIILTKTKIAMSQKKEKILRKYFKKMITNLPEMFTPPSRPNDFRVTPGPGYDKVNHVKRLCRAFKRGKLDRANAYLDKVQNYVNN